MFLMHPPPHLVRAVICPPPPLQARIRLHYGHPDMFNKMFVLTRGGISKGTRLLHLTEDVFCGCNHTLRGGRIR